MTARFLECTTAEYHRDPCPTPSLSSSIARELILRSPAHAWELHPRGGGTKREDTEATTSGTLIHSLVLGKGAEQLAVLDVKDFRKKAAKEARDDAEERGLTVIKKSDYDKAVESAGKLKKSIAARGLSLSGTSEEKIEWTEETTEGQVLCRGMMDHLNISWAPAGACIVDLKSIRSADTRTIQRHVHDYGYDIQEAAYRSAVSKISPDFEGRIDVVFLFVELDPPHVLRPVRLNGMWRSMGLAKWNRACSTWARCLRTQTWPDYEPIEQLEVPPYLLSELTEGE